MKRIVNSSLSSQNLESTCPRDSHLTSMRSRSCV
jgi:hypothetical protein